MDKPKPPANEAERSKLRTGFTTGACSAAAARAAALCCLDGIVRISVDTVLPNNDKHTFALLRCEPGEESKGWIVSIKKFAGDDPDCTDGAHLTAWVVLSKDAGVRITAGDGVATVTKPGLGLSVGSPAITEVPRRNLTNLVSEVIEGSVWSGADVELSVPGGEEMAKQTLNSRLGLVGGISILGTTGIVKPYSTAAYRASVVHAIDLAGGVGLGTVVLTTGGRSERYAMNLRPDLPEEAFIQVGDFIGTGLQHAKRAGMPRALIVGMIGKLAKMADGFMMTHAKGSKVNMPMLSEIARGIGAGSDVVQLIANANTGRHVMEIVRDAELADFFSAVCHQVVDKTEAHAGGKNTSGESLAVATALVDFEGLLLGCWPPGSFEQAVHFEPTKS